MNFTATSTLIFDRAFHWPATFLAIGGAGFSFGFRFDFATKGTKGNSSGVFHDGSFLPVTMPPAGKLILEFFADCIEVFY